MLNGVWGRTGCVDERTADVHIGRLRKARDHRGFSWNRFQRGQRGTMMIYILSVAQHYAKNSSNTQRREHFQHFARCTCGWRRDRSDPDCAWRWLRNWQARVQIDAANEQPHRILEIVHGSAVHTYQASTVVLGNADTAAGALTRPPDLSLRRDCGGWNARREWGSQ